MWQASRFRVRAYTQGLIGTRKEVKLETVRIQFKRAHAEIAIPAELGTPPQLVSARVILNDLGPTGISLFTNRALELGQVVSLRMEQPTGFYVSGRVLDCRTYQLNPKILHKHPFPYRVCLEFIFLNDGEMETVRHYCEVLARSLTKGIA